MPDAAELGLSSNAQSVRQKMFLGGDIEKSAPRSEELNFSRSLTLPPYMESVCCVVEGRVGENLM